MRLERIKKQIIPTEKERKEDLDLANRIIGFIKERFGLEAMLVGSIAKGTYIRGKKDMDIFVLFDKSTPREELEKTGMKIGREVAKFLGGKWEKHYAEHPYSRIKLRDREIEVVPAYKIKLGDKIISAVDRTPLHTRYVMQNLKKPEDVILLKWFLKQIGVYGAEIEIEGFSGYLCELLVIYYGSFQRVLEEASVWEPPVVIDPAGFYEDRSKILEKFNDPLVVIDPVDPSRNVASPVSLDSLAKFVLAARMFLETGKLPRKERINTKNRKILVIGWKIGEENGEILWGQLKALARRIERSLEENGFRVSDSLVWTDCKRRAEILLDLEVDSLPPVQDWPGPSVFDFKNSMQFIRKHKNIFIKNGKLWAEKRRRYKDYKSLIRDLLKNPPSHLGGSFKFIKPSKSNAFKIYSKKLWSW